MFGPLLAVVMVVICVTLWTVLLTSGRDAEVEAILECDQPGCTCGGTIEHV